MVNNSKMQGMTNRFRKFTSLIHIRCSEVGQ